MTNFNPLSLTSLLDSPEHLSSLASWHIHIPFAFAAIELLQPKVFVELGTHQGDSYLAFCQAVKRHNLPTKCFAVDTWEGDEHAGYYGEEVYATLRENHDSKYGSFSSLMRISRMFESHPLIEEAI